MACAGAAPESLQPGLYAGHDRDLLGPDVPGPPQSVHGDEHGQYLRTRPDQMEPLGFDARWPRGLGQRAPGQPRGRHADEPGRQRVLGPCRPHVSRQLRAFAVRRLFDIVQPGHRCEDVWWRIAATNARQADRGWPTLAAAGREADAERGGLPDQPDERRDTGAEKSRSHRHVLRADWRGAFARHRAERGRQPDARVIADRVVHLSGCEEREGERRVAEPLAGRHSAAAPDGVAVG